MEFPITILVTAGTVAWYAALISTALLIVKVLEYYRERTKVVLKCKGNYRVYGEGLYEKLYEKDKDYVVITVINKGKRPVTIQNVGFSQRNRNDKEGILADSFKEGPRELSEGKSTDYLVQQDLIDLEKIKYFVAYDQTGRQYKGKLKRQKKNI